MRKEPQRHFVNALQPGTVEKVVLHPVERRAVVSVFAGQVNLVQGHRGENRELVSELTGWQLEVEEL
jgi:transcription antitermination factor NusA-like protein